MVDILARRPSIITQGLIPPFFFYVIHLFFCVAFRPFLTAKYFREIFVQNFSRQIFLRRTIWGIWKASCGSDFFFWFSCRIWRRFDQAWPGEEGKGTFFIGLCISNTVPCLFVVSRTFSVLCPRNWRDLYGNPPKFSQTNQRPISYVPDLLVATKRSTGNIIVTSRYDHYDSRSSRSKNSISSL